jgi:hypothetical protein
MIYLIIISIEKTFLFSIRFSLRTLRLCGELMDVSLKKYQRRTIVILAINQFSHFSIAEIKTTVVEWVGWVGVKEVFSFLQ